MSEAAKFADIDALPICKQCRKERNAEVRKAIKDLERRLGVEK